jgi:putative transport protein
VNYVLEQVNAFLLAQPIMLLFLVLGLGYLVGNISLFGISLGAVGGVLLVGLFFGHFGHTLYSGAQTFGFVLFIFCVGIQAGPKFFDVLMTSGLKYLSLALLVAATGFGLSMFLAEVLDFAPGLAAGLMGGAMTTTPTLAAAQDAVNSGLVNLPEGMSREQVLTNIGAGYALTYLFGLIGLILIVRLMPRFLGIDLPAAAAELEGDSADDVPNIAKLSSRVYRITQPKVLGMKIREIESMVRGSATVIAARREGERLPLKYDTQFQLGDEVLVIGDANHLLANSHRIGEEIADELAHSVAMETAQVVVANDNVIGKAVDDIELAEWLGVLPLMVRRNRREIPLTQDLVLQRGDVLTVHGPEEFIDKLAQYIGHVERDVSETDLFTFALGAAAGIALGTVSVSMGGVTIGLGLAGGLLISGLVIGFLRSVWPVFGRVPSAARWLMMELGLLIFMAGVGLNSGAGIVDIIREAGVQLIGAGILVTLLPVFVGYFFSRKVLRLNPAEALGAVTGAMTSGAALSVVNDAAKSNAPALGYTGTYAFANVILTVAGTLIMLL